MRREQIDRETRDVLSFLPTIDFRLEPYAKGKEKLRLAVYSNKAFEDNLRLYIDELVPECRRMADSLNGDGYSYKDAKGIRSPFVPIDVEMAVFSWGIENPNAF